MVEDKPIRKNRSDQKCGIRSVYQLREEQNKQIRSEQVLYQISWETRSDKPACTYPHRARSVISDQLRDQL
ncbi:hypothetical protein F511_15296 [Dorcoceras hygrometricum]|uniref:Uncharacterized protein n=1 Tax=Dorcoceras hygrometricum TaxID=472368 RepID=A0A2Z7AEB1_9LAMI|nr:hypothetical protein F511_15296 [Dorcoceras hygrometricum]